MIKEDNKLYRLNVRGGFGYINDISIIDEGLQNLSEGMCARYANARYGSQGNVSRECCLSLILESMGSWHQTVVGTFSFLVFISATVVIFLIATKRPKNEVAGSHRLSSAGLLRKRILSPATSSPLPLDRTDHVMSTPFTERREQIRTACKQSGGLQTLNAAQSYNVYRHMIVDDEYKLIYCYVPKAACTSWKKVMLVLAGSSPDVGKARAPHMRSKHKILSDFTESEREKRMKNYTKFMVHREPLSRLLSAYIDKFTKYSETRTRYGRKIIAMYRENPSKQSLQSGDDVKFSEFVQFVLGAVKQFGWLKLSEHWQPQVSLCQPCTVDYDYYSEMQTVERDAKVILRSVGASSVKFPQTHVTKSSQNMTQFYSDIDPRFIGRLLTLYRKDFAIFGYKKPVGF